MKFPTKSFAALVAAVGMSSSAHATDLLNLINPVFDTSASYNLVFTATSTSSTLTDGGYQLPGFTDFTDNSVVDTGGGGNLLGQTWVFTPAASGSDTSQYSDGTSVNALSFGGVTVGSYDEYSQTFATVAGDTYVYSFTVPYFDGNPDGYFVTVTNATVAGGVPEPATWALMISGMLCLGAALRQRRAMIAA
jgi:hypothetical protein